MIEIKHNKPLERENQASLGVNSMPSRSGNVSFLGETLTGGVLVLGATSRSTLSATHSDPESNAVNSRLPYQASDSQAVSRTAVFSPSGRFVLN